MVAPVEEYLEGLCNVFERDSDKWIFVSGNRDLKMLNAMLFQEMYILGGVFLGYQSPFEQSGYASLLY